MVGAAQGKALLSITRILGPPPEVQATTFSSSRVAQEVQGTNATWLSGHPGTMASRAFSQGVRPAIWSLQTCR